MEHPLRATVLAIVSLVASWQVATSPVRSTDPTAQTASAAIPEGLSPALDAIDSLVTVELSRQNLGAMTIGVVADDRLVWVRSYGLADIDNQVRATADSVYRIGSITKQFTALMLLQLVERGQVRLSDPVARYLPEVARVRGAPANAASITLGQIATMTAGLAREPDNLASYVTGPVSNWEATLLAALSDTRFVAEPGTTYLYSNIGYAMLGAALGRAAGQPYTRYVQQHILAPLGMHSTVFEPDAATTPRLARGYEVVADRRPGADRSVPEPSAGAVRIDRDTPAREHAGRGYKVPNGALYTTVGDMARFVAFQLGSDVPAVLRRSTLDDTFARARSSETVLRTGYGTGFQLLRRGRLFVYGHAGTVLGYTAAAYFERESRVGVVVLRNVGGDLVDVNAIALQSVERLAAARRTRSSSRRGANATR